MKYSSLESALKCLGQYAFKQKCTVHLPRIGYGLDKFNWYGTERMIRKFLCRRNVPTYIYYFSRHAKQQRRRTAVEDEAGDSPKSDSEPSSSKKMCSEDSPVTLPTIFDGFTFLFVDVSEAVAKRLGRFVTAYDGHWTLDKNSSGITHVVVEDETVVSVDDIIF